MTLEARLHAANQADARAFPGDPRTRQPVHTFYGGAHLFTPNVCSKLGKLALRGLDDNAPFPGVTGDIIDRVRAKLKSEPVEDYRIDFEDGYGKRPGVEEDAHAASCAQAVAESMRDGLLPPFIGIRIKPLTAGHYARAFRTLDIFLATLLDRTGGVLPPNFIVTLPKIVTAQHTATFAELCEVLEPRFHLPARSLKFEFMVETTQAVLILPEILGAARGRCTAAHFGAYDYTASCGLSAANQHMLHPACDFARNMMKVALSGRGIFLSDGGTNILPVGDRASVHSAWQLHFSHVRHSLENGFYQGWDLHPAQLVSRYAAVYSFFREGFRDASARLANFSSTSGQATLTGDVFDDAATGLALMNYLNRAVQCGAVSSDEISSV